MQVGAAAQLSDSFVSRGRQEDREDGANGATLLLIVSGGSRTPRGDHWQMAFATHANA